VDRRDDGEAERQCKLELTGVVVRSFRCTRAKLGRLGSTSGSRRCSRSTGSGMGGGSGGCRRRAEAAVEVRRGGELGKRKSSANVGVGMQEWVRGELQDVLGVQKKAWAREQERASSATCVAARATAARCGEAGRVQRGVGSGGAVAGAARGTEESGAGTAGAWHMAGEV
jgi:hypothetical protein